MKSILSKLFNGGTLSKEEASSAMDLLMEGKAPPEQIGAFLGILRGRKETVEEIAGCASSMRNHAKTLNLKRTDLVDTCGTGGDGAGTFNISTVNAFIIAAAGLGVVKHGNRSVSSKCGSADVLEKLGVPIDLPLERVQEAVETLGFGFLFAPAFHPAMKNVVPIRKSLGVRTVFNLLGPLTNPAGAKRQVIGIYDRQLLETLAKVLRELGSEEVMLVTGSDGLDEITISGSTDVAHLRNGEISLYQVSPKDFGVEPAPLSAVEGGDVALNTKIALDILGGEEKGPKRDIVLMNASAVFVVTGKVENFMDGMALARDIIDSGKAMAVLEKLKEFR